MITRAYMALFNAERAARAGGFLTTAPAGRGGGPAPSVALVLRRGCRWAGCTGEAVPGAASCWHHRWTYLAVGIRAGVVRVAPHGLTLTASPVLSARARLVGAGS